MNNDREANQKVTFINTYFDDDDEDETNAVQELQQKLFPPVPLPNTPSAPGGYFMNIIVKPNQVDEENSEQFLIKKESKELFAVVRDPSATIQAARWPTECQVLDEKIRHINFTPAVPEPYYVPTGKEVQPKPVGEELGIIIYQYYPISAVNYFSRSSVAGSRFLLPTCPSPEEDSLRFESRFEGGNLAKAIKITATYYELYLRTDLYTNKHMQWFYFRVFNMKKNINYRFSIVNMTKDGSLFNEGMKPLLYSTKDAQLHHIGWRRCGDNITYFCNETAETEDPDQITTYTLTFTLEFPHEADFAYLAYSYPYTYTDLQDYLLDLAKHPIKSTYTTLRLLCRTLAGNNLYYVTITAPPEPDDDTKKKAVIITGRVHPGEAPASWMMKGILDFLTGDSGPAKELREKFLFKIVPMLNPDGVIVGNSRCCLSGRDLNRQYRTVIRESYPSIWYTKLLIRRSGMVEEYGVAMYVDLHAHSRKHNIFIYGCENRRVVEKRLYEQVFPLMLHKNTADKFSFEGCKFRVNRCKEGTGRVVMWMMGIGNSYTMEASFGGSLIGTRAETHFSTLDYEQMGRSFCQTLLDFYDSDPRKEKLRTKILERLHQEGSNADEPTNIPLSDFSSDEGDTSSSSDEGGRLEFNTRIIVPPPSPVLQRKLKPKNERSKGKTNLKNALALAESRKIYHICKTTLDLSLPHIKTKYSSDSSSDAESMSLNVKKKVVRKRRAKKNTKKRHGQFLKVSDTDIHDKSPRSLSVMDLAPMTKFRSHSWHRQIVPPKPLVDTRNSKNTTQQLAEVQAKLVSLKNRLWFGSGEGDASIPLSWGQSKLSENKHKSKKSTKKQSKSESRNEKAEMKSDKKGKNKEDGKEKPTKKKHQSQKKTMQWTPPDDITKTDVLRSEKKRIDDEFKKIENSQEKKIKKKKKPPKLQKKANLVSTMTVFIARD